MTAVARYLLADYARSRRFIAPLLVLIAGVVVAYAQAPNPVLSSASSVVAPLFATQSWFVLALLNSQGDADRHVLAASVGGRVYVLGRMLAAGLLALAASLSAVAYPLVAGRFDHTPSLAQLAVILLANLTATIAASALAALFARPLIYNRAISVLGLSLCVVLTVPLDLPGAAIATARALNAGHAADVPARLAGDIASMLIFTAAVGIICARAWSYRD